MHKSYLEVKLMSNVLNICLVLKQYLGFTKNIETDPIYALANIRVKDVW